MSSQSSSSSDSISRLIAEAEKLLAEISDGPWRIAENADEAGYWWFRPEVNLDREVVVIAEEDRPICATNDDGLVTNQDVANAKFIASAPLIVRQLLDLVALLRSEQEESANAAVAKFAEDCGMNKCAVCGDGLSVSTRTTCADCDHIIATRHGDEMFLRGWHAAMRQAREVFQRHYWDVGLDEMLAVLDAVHEREP